MFQEFAKTICKYFETQKRLRKGRGKAEDKRRERVVVTSRRRSKEQALGTVSGGWREKTKIFAWPTCSFRSR